MARLIAITLAFAILCGAQCVNLCALAGGPEPPKSSCHGGSQESDDNCLHKVFAAATTPNELVAIAILPVAAIHAEQPAIGLLAATSTHAPPTPPAPTHAILRI